MEKSDHILSFQSLQIGFKAGSKIIGLLSPMSEHADAGEITAIIGRNGIGKSTLLRTLAGIQKALGGDILYDRKSNHLISRNELSRLVGFSSTEIPRAGNMTVTELVALGRYPYTSIFGTMEAEDRRQINWAMEKTGIMSLADRNISGLSDGERQKAMIARVLAQDTRLILMDEPTAFLDVRGKFEILELLIKLARDERKAIIFSTHDMNMAVSHADKIWLILENGIKAGSPEDLMIQRTFDHLFESSDINFDNDRGTYSLKRGKKGSIFVEGDGINLHWTREAVRRAGYDVASTPTKPFIRTGDGQWQIVNDKVVVTYPNIYLLMRGLNTTI